MRLKQVKLSGFKSFCDNTELSFDADGITMVVGPNGCGKSNVVDAVRWALGEQSPRLMRSSAMADVIFAGSTSRKPVGRAEVTLLFDNSAHTAVDRYNDYGEIAVTRRLYRSGESEYLINKLPARLMDIRELIMDTGAAGRSYSIVEQGRVDEFVTASPQDRRAFMEEAAGIVRYKTKRIAAEKKLEQTRQNLLRVEDVLRELERQEGLLREQMETAREYRALQAEVALLRGDLARLRHTRSAAACRELEAQVATLNEQATLREQVLLRNEAEAERLSVEQTRQEAALRQARGALYGKEREIQQAQHQLDLYRQDERNQEAWRAQLSRTLTDLQQAQVTAAEQRMEVFSLSATLEGDAEAMRVQIAQVEARHADAQAAVEAAGEHAATLQEQLLECHTQLTGIENQQRFLDERLQDEEQRRSAVHGRINAVATEQEQVLQTQAGLAARSAELDEAARVARREADALAERLLEQEAALDAHREREREAERQALEARSRQESLAQIEADYEGFGDNVRGFLGWVAEHPEQGQALGVVGPLADLLTVPMEATACSGDYLAPYLETVVVRSSAALPQVAERLEALNAGGVRFIALDRLPPAPAAAGNGDGHGATGAASAAGTALTALLETEDDAAAVAAALFGATHVLGDGSAPDALPHPPDGVREWIAADGAFHVDAKARVTLGQAPGPAAGMLKRRAELAALRVRVAELEATVAVLAEEGHALAGQIASLQDERREAEERCTTLNLQRKELEQEQSHAQKDLQRLEQVREAVEREAEQFEAELERFATQQVELAAGRTQWQEARTRLEAEAVDARAAEAEARAALAVVSEELTERKVAQGQVTSRLEAQQARLGELTEEQEQAAVKLEETEAALLQQRDKHEQLTHDIAGLEAALVAHHEALEQLRGAERAQREAFDRLSEQHRVLAEQVKGERRDHEQQQSRIHDLDLKLATERMRMEQHAEQLAALPPRPAGAEPAEGDEKALEGRLAAAQARLNRMEGVNLGAPEEYEALEQRLTFLRAQQEDLNRASEDLETSIRRMNVESRRRFRETFDQVNEKFQTLFPQVFGGGEARLVMTDSDDPLEAGVDIVAQPPGKKLQSLNLLSGGEKALTAISLIFAFFLHKPSPFCLLDEVDAPLDDVNVTRFNRLIHSMTRQSQFIIVTHNKRTMEVADRLYGVTMEEAGVSKIVSVNLAGAA